MIFMITNFLFMLTIVHGQTTSSPHQLTQQFENIKNKRGLYDFDDSLIGPPPPPPFQTISYGPSSSPRTILSPSKWTNVFGFDDITYQHLYNELNGINYGIPTHITPPPTAAPSIYNNGFNYLNYGSPHDYDSSYISHDGRIVKQYSVHERHHNDHPDPRTFQPIPSGPSGPAGPPQTMPTHYPSYFFRPNINVAQPRTLFTNPRAPNPNQIPTFLNKNHGPIALGSGSLGFVRLPNGDVFLGSGSLGYISHKDHYDNVVEITSRRQKAHPRGPTTFGHSHL